MKNRPRDVIGGESDGTKYQQEVRNRINVPRDRNRETLLTVCLRVSVISIL